MEENTSNNYPNNIEEILKKEYPWLDFDINLDVKEKGTQIEQL